MRLPASVTPHPVDVASADNRQPAHVFESSDIAIATVPGYGFAFAGRIERVRRTPGRSPVQRFLFMS